MHVCMYMKHISLEVAWLEISTGMHASLLELSIEPLLLILGQRLGIEVLEYGQCPVDLSRRLQIFIYGLGTYF